MADDPTPRRGEALPDDHPLALDAQMAECVDDVPEYLLDDLVDYYTERGGIPQGEPVPDGEELV